MHILKTCKRAFYTGLLLAPLLVLSVVPTARAAVQPQNIAPMAKVSFTFDDGLASAITQAAPALAAHGLTGTDYVITNCVGMTTVPNTCAADTDMPYMTWQQVTQLRDTYGWEIGGHTVDHPQLATDNLTDAQLSAEITGNKQALAAHGIDATNFATPYGDYDNRVLAEIAKTFASHRGFADVDNNIWSYNDYLLNNMQVQAGATVAQVKARIDQAITNKHWLVLTFHEIRPTASTNPNDYQYSTADLSAIAAYVKTKQDASQIKAVNIKDGLVTSNVNLLTNGSLESGISSGWTTDTPASVVADSGNHGSYPESTKSVAITAPATGNAHLFTPKIAVDSTKNYLLKSYLNLKARTSGEVGYYIDEYNSAGNWVSGQWVKAQTALFAGNINFPYKPTSTSVKKASLQVYATGGSGIQAYVDSFQWFPLETTTTPPPTTTTNLLPNSTFDNGLSGGWTTNNASVFTADSGNHGSTENPVNALKILSGSSNASLFAPLVTVDGAVTYNLSAYLNVLTRTSGEVAFYIDEYDAAGNWVSGQYQFAKRNTGIEVLNFDYTPTSTTVKKAGLQVIATGGSGITGYLDNVQFNAPQGSTPTPPTPPTLTNLVPNGTFDAGIAEGWSTNDPTNITADSGNHGSPANAQKAVKILSGTQNRHLFSGLVTVSNTSSYSLSSYLNIQQITSGEIGFYIDEYDAAGNWVSGQYKTGLRAVGAGDVNFSYTPTSSAVSKAGLQVIVTGNSGIQAYFDDVRWYKN